MKQKNKRGFASDNNPAVHPKILQAIIDANTGHTIAYGDDDYTQKAIKKIKEHFGENIDVYFVFNGTGANVLGLKALTNPFNSITTISYQISKETFVDVSIYNILGQEMKQLVNKKMMPGQYSVTWDGTDSNGTKVTSGLYLYRIQAGRYSATKKLLFMK